MTSYFGKLNVGKVDKKKIVALEFQKIVGSEELTAKWSRYLIETSTIKEKPPASTTGATGAKTESDDKCELNAML